MDSEFRNIHKSRKPEANLVPLINIVFLLLIFFMVAGTQKSISQNKNIILPISKTAETTSAKLLTIFISKKNEYVLEEKIISEKNLEEVVKNYLKEDKQKLILIKTDKSLESHKLISLMSLLSEFKAYNIAIETDIVL